MLFKLRMGLINFYNNLTVAHFASNISAFLRLYHDSLIALVGGYREVTMDAKGEVRLDSGATVEEKVKEWENKLGEYAGGV